MEVTNGELLIHEISDMDERVKVQMVNLLTYLISDMAEKGEITHVNYCYIR